jgi:hypothetical protein
VEVTGTFYGGGLASNVDEKIKDQNAKFKKALNDYQKYD